MEHWDRDSLGERKKLPDGTLGEYEYVKYKSIQLYSLAMQSQDQTTVPVYDTLGTKAVKYIVTHCEMSVIAVTEEKLPSLQELLRGGCCKR